MSDILVHQVRVSPALWSLMTAFALVEGSVQVPLNSGSAYPAAKPKQTGWPGIVHAQLAAKNLQSPWPKVLRLAAKSLAAAAKAPDVRLATAFGGHAHRRTSQSEQRSRGMGSRSMRRRSKLKMRGRRKRHLKLTLCCANERESEKMVKHPTRCQLMLPLPL
eukprot:3941092-Amphidinium_carterae.1